MLIGSQEFAPVLSEVILDSWGVFDLSTSGESTIQSFDDFDVAHERSWHSGFGEQLSAERPLVETARKAPAPGFEGAKEELLKRSWVRLTTPQLGKLDSGSRIAGRVAAPRSVAQAAQCFSCAVSSPQFGQ